MSDSLFNSLATKLGRKENISKQFEAELGDITDDGAEVRTIFGRKFAFIFSLILAVRALLEFVGSTIVFIVLIAISSNQLLAIPYVAALLGGVLCLFAALFSMLGTPLVSSKIFISDQNKRIANQLVFNVVTWILLVPAILLMFGAEIYTIYWIMDFFYDKAPKDLNRAIFGGFCGLLVLAWSFVSLLGILFGCCGISYNRKLQKLRRHKEELSGTRLMMDNAKKTLSAVLSFAWPFVSGLVSIVLAILATVGFAFSLQYQDWLFLNRDLTQANIIIVYVYYMIACAIILLGAIFGCISSPATGGIISLKPRLAIAVFYWILHFVGHVASLLAECVCVGICLFYGFATGLTRYQMYYIIPIVIVIFAARLIFIILGAANIVYLRRRIRDFGGNDDNGMELKNRA